MKNTVLKTLAVLNLFVFIIAVCALDSDSWVPLIVMCITGAYLGLFAYANDWFYDY